MNKHSGRRNGRFQRPTAHSPAKRLGGHRVGEWHGKAKWPDQIVRAMRRDYQPGVLGKGILAMARKYDVPYSTAKDILQYKTRGSA